MKDQKKKNEIDQVKTLKWKIIGNNENPENRKPRLHSAVYSSTALSEDLRCTWRVRTCIGDENMEDEI